MRLTDLAAAVQSAAVADAEPKEAVEDCTLVCRSLRAHPNPRMTLRAAVLPAASTDGYLMLFKPPQHNRLSFRSMGAKRSQPRLRLWQTAPAQRRQPPRWRAHSLGVHSPSTSRLREPPPLHRRKTLHPPLAARRMLALGRTWTASSSRLSCAGRCRPCRTFRLSCERIRRALVFGCKPFAQPTSARELPKASRPHALGRCFC